MFLTVVWMFVLHPWREPPAPHHPPPADEQQQDLSSIIPWWCGVREIKMRFLVSCGLSSRFLWHLQVSRGSPGLQCTVLGAGARRMKDGMGLDLTELRRIPSSQSFVPFRDRYSTCTCLEVPSLRTPNSTFKSYEESCTQEVSQAICWDFRAQRGCL